MNARRHGWILGIPLVLVILLACEATSFSSGLGKVNCEAKGGTWRQEVGQNGEVDEWCEMPKNEQAGSISQPTEPSDQLEPGNLSVEECSATAYLKVSAPDLGWDENDCACGYHITFLNSHPDNSVVVFTHLTSRDEGGIQEQWSFHRDDPIGPGESRTDGGSGWEVARWGGFYSTCQMVDGELTYPVYFHTDRIGAVLAVDGCNWITDASQLASISTQLPNYCEGQ